MTEDKWNTVVRIKADGTGNLDRLTRVHAPDLQTFFAFSSVSSLIGNPGQSNYAWGCGMMEEICRKRHEDDLPAACVQYGWINDVGYVTRLEAFAGDAVPKVGPLLEDSVLE